MPLDGRQLGYYRLLHMLGRGGMGEVYLADDIRIPRQVTAKVINRGRSQPAQDTQLLVVVLAGGGFWLATTANSSADSAQQTRITDSKDREATQAQQNVTATAIANDPYLSGKGTLLANDALSGPKLWQGSTSGDWGGTCAFKGGTYHITQSIAQQRYYHCGEESFQANNFIYEVRITVINGNCGGITFRYNAKEHSGYRFYICSDGTARLNVYPTGSSFTSLVAGTYPALRKGYNQENTIATLANGNHIDLYINKQKIASITDDTLNKGEFALFAVGFDKPTEVAFRDVKIWRL